MYRLGCPQQHGVALRRTRCASALVAAIGLVFAASSSAIAQEAANTRGAGSSAPRVNPLTRKLLDLLISKGVITSEQAEQMIRDANAEEAIVRDAQGGPGATAQSAPEHTVPYIPEPVRKEIKEQLRKEMLEEAKSQGLVERGVYPDWTKQLTFFGDVRVRGELVAQERTNYNLFPNWTSINNSAGWDTLGFDNPPLLNTTEDRKRARIRARFGVNAQVDTWIQAGIRIATGSDTSPVTTNQTLGGNGEFAKYSLWLDRAYIRLEPISHFLIDAGRAENPYWTTDIIFDDDLNFDGLSLRFLPTSSSTISAFGAAGIYPLFNTAFNVGNTDIQKAPSHDKYLVAGELGVLWNAMPSFSVKGSMSYFRFEKVQGQLSSPCETVLPNCDTDLTRPLFTQQGNTMFAIRTLVPPPGQLTLTSPARQYYGLASKFDVAEAHLEFAFKSFNPIVAKIEGEYIRNNAFDAAAIRTLNPVNNFGAAVSIQGQAPAVGEGEWEGGNVGWMGRLSIGYEQIKKLGAWNVSVGYKHLESDATLDAFTDSDFHLGGTNAQGAFATMDFGLGVNTALGLKWFSADEITGPPLSNRIFMLDLSTKF